MQDGRQANRMRASAITLLLLAVALAAQGAEAGQVWLKIQVQSCHEPEFAFLFNDEAREAFDACNEPLTDFTVLLLGKGGVLAEMTSDENGEAILGPVSIDTEAKVDLAICNFADSCIKCRDLSISGGLLREGRNFVLYQDGRAETQDAEPNV